MNTMQKFVFLSVPITHQFEFAVGRNETDRSVVVEARQTHALMEFDVLRSDWLDEREQV